MSNYSQKAYFADTLALLRSMSIKSEYSAKNINDFLIVLYGSDAVDKLDKRSWKYYMNVCGMLHPTDEKIFVRSMDTGEEIEFTPSSFDTHVATYRAFKPGNQKYKELIAGFNVKDPKYFAHHTLINGILFPSDIDTAIEAKDFTILSYDKSLVEPQEESLISFVQESIYGYVDRFYVPAMNISDDLYGVAFIGQLMHYLLPLIINYRQSKIQTSEAHSFHVRNFLASHNRLDNYYDVMSDRQRAFFYKNIRYIERNRGKQSTFDKLREELLTTRGLPLSAYSLTRSHDNVSEEGVSDSLSYIPSISFKSKNLSEIPSMSPASVNAQTMLDKTISIVSGNKDVYDDEKELIEGSVAFGMLSEMSTKIIESSSLQTSEGSSASLQDTALSLWGYCAARGMFKTFVYFTDPNTGEEIGLNAINAYHYFMYAYMQTTGATLVKIPPVIAIDAPVWPKPSFSSVYALVEQKDVPESFARRLYNQVPLHRQFINNDTFHAFVEEFNNVPININKLVSSQTSLLGHATSQHMAGALLRTQLIPTSQEGQPYETFLEENGLPASGLSINQWKTLQQEIFYNATGQQLTQIEAKSMMHEAMVKMFRVLSSYAVQLIADISSAGVKSLSWSALRIGQSREAARQLFRVETIPLKILGFYSDAQANFYIDVPDFFKGKATLSPPSDVPYMDMSFTGSLKPAKSMQDSILDFGIVAMHALKDPSKMFGDLSDYEHMPPILTTEQLLQRRDGYHSMCMRYPSLPTKISLEEFVKTAYIPSFDVMQPKNRILRGWYGFSIPANIRYFGSDVTYYELDGFEWIFGDVYPETFSSNFGDKLLELFEFSGYIEPEIERFQYTFASIKDIAFKQGPTNETLDIGGFSVYNSMFNVQEPLRVGDQHTLHFDMLKTPEQFSFNVMPAKVNAELIYRGTSQFIDFNHKFGTLRMSMYFYGDPIALTDQIEVGSIRVTPGVDFTTREGLLRLPNLDFTARSFALDTAGGFAFNVPTPYIGNERYQLNGFTLLPSVEDIGDIENT